MISIIIPCYNAENFINSCFESLLLQSNKNFEVIFINDGSKDCTEEKLAEVVQKDNRFSAYTTKNQGAALARLYGVSKSRFEYVTFLDIDDSFHNDFIKIFLKNIEHHDILSCGFKSTGKKCEAVLKFQPGSYDQKQFISNLTKLSGWEMWGKVYKKSLFDNIDMPTRKLFIAEDAFVFFQLVLNSNSILVIDEYLYYYLVHSDSISHNKSEKHIEDGLFVADYLSKKLKTIVSKKEIDMMVLLFYSNSLRRGFLKKDNPYLINVYNALNFKALSGLPFLKAFFVTIMFFLNQLKY